tara:strand:- start:20 stop:508 length:489 start_codon:yes stop_codon:yes gene_type:complete
MTLKEKQSLDSLVIQKLKKKSLKISVAESCTGGALASEITKTPGASSYFKGSIVCYSKSSKVNILKISSDLIESEGLVSEKVAREMAINSNILFKTDLALSITGNAGPTGGDLIKEIGIVFIGIAKLFDVKVFKFCFSGDREGIIKKAVNESFLILYKELNK